MINTCVSTVGNVQMERERGMEEWGGVKSVSINQSTIKDTSAVVYLVFCDGLQQGLSVRVDGETFARLCRGGGRG